MSDKISPVAVVKEALGVITANSGAFGVFMLTAVVLEFVLGAAQRVPDEVNWIGSLVGIGVALAGYPKLFQGVIHRTLSTLRDKEEFLGKIWMFLLGLIALKIIMGLMVPATVIVIAILQAFLKFFLGDYTSVFLAILLSFIIVSRFGFILPAIAVKDQYDYSFAWKIGKGHTLRIMLTLLPFIALMAVESMMLAESAKDWGLGLLSPGIGLTLVGYGIMSVVMWTVYSVWYVRLRERYEKMQEPAVAEETSPESGSELVSE